MKLPRPILKKLFTDFFMPDVILHIKESMKREKPLRKIVELQKKKEKP